MDEIVIQLTINKWLIFVCVVIVFLSFVGNVLSLIDGYFKKNEHINIKNDGWVPVKDNTTLPPRGKLNNDLLKTKKHEKILLELIRKKERNDRFCLVNNCSPSSFMEGSNVVIDDMINFIEDLK